MKFLMISSYLPSVLNFRGKLLEAIHAQGLEIYVLADSDLHMLYHLRSSSTIGQLFRKNWSCREIATVMGSRFSDLQENKNPGLMKYTSAGDFSRRR